MSTQMIPNERIKDRKSDFAHFQWLPDTLQQNYFTQILMTGADFINGISVQNSALIWLADLKNWQKRSVTSMQPTLKVPIPYQRPTNYMNLFKKLGLELLSHTQDEFVLSKNVNLNALLTALRQFMSIVYSRNHTTDTFEDGSASSSEGEPDLSTAGISPTLSEGSSTTTATPVPMDILPPSPSNIPMSSCGPTSGAAVTTVTPQQAPNASTIISTTTTTIGNGNGSGGNLLFGGSNQTSLNSYPLLSPLKSSFQNFPTKKENQVEDLDWKDYANTNQIDTTNQTLGQSGTDMIITPARAATRASAAMGATISDNIRISPNMMNTPAIVGLTSDDCEDEKIAERSWDASSVTLRDAKQPLPPVSIRTASDDKQLQEKTQQDIDMQKYLIQTQELPPSVLPNIPSYTTTYNQFGDSKKPQMVPIVLTSPARSSTSSNGSSNGTPPSDTSSVSTAVSNTDLMSISSSNPTPFTTNTTNMPFTSTNGYEIPDILQNQNLHQFHPIPTTTAGPAPTATGVVPQPSPFSTQFTHSSIPMTTTTYAATTTTNLPVIKPLTKEDSDQLQKRIQAQHQAANEQLIRQMQMAHTQQGYIPQTTTATAQISGGSIGATPNLFPISTNSPITLNFNNFTSPNASTWATTDYYPTPFLPSNDNYGYNAGNFLNPTAMTTNMSNPITAATQFQQLPPVTTTTAHTTITSANATSNKKKKDETKPAKKKGRCRRACEYCHYSHLRCGNERPCQRCKKRGIECKDYAPPKRNKNGPSRRAEKRAEKKRNLKQQQDLDAQIMRDIERHNKTKQENQQKLMSTTSDHAFHDSTAMLAQQLGPRKSKKLRTN